LGFTGDVGRDPSGGGVPSDNEPDGMQLAMDCVAAIGTHGMRHTARATGYRGPFDQKSVLRANSTQTGIITIRLLLARYRCNKTPGPCTADP
jgi:hypothetical protein